MMVWSTGTVLYNPLRIPWMLSCTQSINHNVVAKEINGWENAWCRHHPTWPIFTFSTKPYTRYYLKDQNLYLRIHMRYSQNVVPVSHRLHLWGNNIRRYQYPQAFTAFIPQLWWARYSRQILMHCISLSQIRDKPQTFTSPGTISSNQISSWCVCSGPGINDGLPKHLKHDQPDG